MGCQPSRSRAPHNEMPQVRHGRQASGQRSTGSESLHWLNPTARGTFETWPDARRVPFRALNLDPPMVCRSFRGLDGRGGQARFADRERSAPPTKPNQPPTAGATPPGAPATSFLQVSGALRVPKGAFGHARCPERRVQVVEPESPDDLRWAQPLDKARFAGLARCMGPTRGVFETWLDVSRVPFRTLNVPRVPLKTPNQARPSGNDAAGPDPGPALPLRLTGLD